MFPRVSGYGIVAYHLSRPIAKAMAMAMAIHHSREPTGSMKDYNPRVTVELSPHQRRALEATACEVRSDTLTRVLYSTDASIYKIEPQAVAFPKNGQETGRLLAAAADAGLEITPRGAGTGLAGGAVGSGLVVDLARHNRSIADFDPDRRTIRVGPGVVLDRLNL